MTPLVSILIPAYNAEPWIGQTVRSALAQTWPRKEIIIVDDGSKDATLSAARQFAARDVVVIGQENQGAATARNNAFARAQGSYIQWLDADDLLSPDKIARQMEVLARGTVRTLASSEWGAFIYRAHCAQFVPTGLWCDLDPIEWLIRKLRDGLSMQTATWLVSRELTEAAGPWDARLLGDDDGEYFSRVVMQSDQVAFVPGARVYYRRVAPSLSYIGMSQRKIEAQFLALQLYIEHVRSLEDSPRVCEACVALLNSWRMSFFPEHAEISRQMEQMASALGGRLALPEVSWKYAGIQKCFGWTAAKRAQLRYNRLKNSVLCGWDGMLYRLMPHKQCPL